MRPGASVWSHCEGGTPEAIPWFPRPDRRASEPLAMTPTSVGFDGVFSGVFEAEYPRLFRYLDRASGDPDLAADLAQEAFIRLYRRGAMPDRPGVWLITVALNLFRNERSTAVRRHRLLTQAWTGAIAAAEQPTPVPIRESGETSERVRLALRALSQRDQEMLLLRAEGYRYHEIAATLSLKESSIGTLLARAKRAFRDAYQESSGASG
jgi:RNA polymerase sigma-70 factor, ECF subfamily